MGAAERISETEPPPATARAPRRTFAVGASLLREGVVAPEEMVTALSHHGREAGRLPDVLRARGLVVERDLLGVDARNWGIRLVDLDAALPDPRLIDAVSVQDCLRHGLVPWQKTGDVTIVATSRPEEFRRLRPMLEARLGPVAAGLPPRARSLPPSTPGGAIFLPAPPKTGWPQRKAAAPGRVCTIRPARWPFWP